MPVSSQPNTFSPQFSAPQTAQGPSASQGAGSSAWAPVFRGGGGGGGGRRR
jgi:hypothetical protein